MAAHRLYARAGVPRQAILRDGRAPRWAEGWVGSISHTDALAIAALARRDRVRGIGVDVERRGRLTARLLPMILTTAEIERCERGRDLESALLTFSAKEAIYKAVQHEVGGHIGFQDVEVDVADGTFRARCVGDRDLGDAIDAGEGFVELRQELVATLFRVPARLLRR
jgi:4'-phosphopantetheinyl transferase EntD